MQIILDNNASEIAEFYRFVFRDQVAFVSSRSLNQLARGFQRRQRAHQRQIFTLRRPLWMDRSVKIQQWASKASQVAQVGVDPPGGKERADIIGKFETDDRKRPRRAGGRLAVPDEVRRTGTGVIPRRLRPKALQFQDHGSSGRVARGEQRTFRIDDTIFQRFGRRGRGSRSRGSVRRLYSLTKQVPLPQDLDFIRNAEMTTQEEFDAIFSREFDRALRSAR